MNDLAVASLIFSLTYLLIISERVHKTAAALGGGVAVIAFRVLDQEEAFAAIDLNVIFLLVGMMVIANTLGKTGVFQWLAIRTAKAVGGNPLYIMIVLGIIAALGSAFLDNVTTVVLMAPLGLFVAGILGVSPVPFLISLILASNIGGTATLIGDPPNILIGSAAGLSFVDFIVHLTPIILIVLTVFFVALFVFFRLRMRPVAEYQRRVMGLDEREVLGDRRLLYLSMGILGLVVLGFLLHGALELEPATVALAGATALIVVGDIHPRDAFLEVEWTTMFFFVGLFIVVGGVKEAGLLEDVGQSMSDASGGHLWAGTILVLWSGALLSGIVDNIPFTAAMIPVVEELGKDLGVHDSASNPLWWALALGAGLGGNLTLVAASANVYVVGVAERAGYKISFLEFMKWGGLITGASLVLASVYLWLRYLV